MILDKIKRIDSQIELLQAEKDKIIESIKPTDKEIEIFYEFAKKEIAKDINTGSNKCDIFLDLNSEYPDKPIRIEIYSLSKRNIINLFFNYIGRDQEEFNLKYSKFLSANDIITINDNSIYLLSAQTFYTSNICNLINTLNLNIDKIDISNFVKNYYLMKEKIKFIDNNKDLLRLIHLLILQ